jgi:hypothetical protein
MITKKKIGLALAAVLGIALVAPPMMASIGVGQEQVIEQPPPPPPPPPPDEIPVLNISSIPALIQSLADGAWYFVSLAPEIAVLILHMIAGVLAMEMTPDELVAWVTDIVRVLIVTMPSWPDLTPFHPAWIAELPTVIFALIDVLPKILEALPGFISTFIEASPQIYASVLNVIAEEIGTLTDLGMWIEIVLSYFTAIPDFISSWAAGLTGLVVALPEIVSTWIDTFEGEWTGILMPFAQALPDYVYLFLIALAEDITDILPALVNPLASILGIVILLLAIMYIGGSFIIPLLLSLPLIVVSITEIAAALWELVTMLPRIFIAMIDFFLATPPVLVEVLTQIPAILSALIDALKEVFFP